MSLNERIKFCMKEKNINQKQLSLLTNITESSISKYLNDERTPRIDVLVNIAKALGVTTDYLLGEEKKENLNLANIKLVLARGKKSLTEEEKIELIKFILEDND
ncbi:MAG: helix-turn-helix transcriptional regulator [Firmicutes bacterium]|uniref:Helix-turn-helix transcriptional regulator n=1 Tax=Candidatus Onthovivens merdipullorum TaxID=2840889 RepID=A0A9D9DI43_9BACL|nr:helix-turn-helix transcriptional regulator [Candidatus Onthovivens merdipullorum]